MCFKYSSCFGGSPQDYGRQASTPKAMPHAVRAPPTPARSGADRRNGNQGPGYHGNGHTAYYDAPRDGHAYTAAAYAQDKASTYPAADEPTSKLPAWNGRVGDDTGYKARLHEAADKEQQNAMDYHRYPTTTTTTRARY